MKNLFLALMFGCALSAATTVRAITFGPFGVAGQGGSLNGQTFTIGPGGTVFEWDGFLSIGGMDLNGAQYGTSAQLSRDSLPAGLSFGFSTNLSPDLADLVLTYTFTNGAGNAFSNVTFFVLLDAEIDETNNTFYNEYGSTIGIAGQYGYDPSQWQIDEPGFQAGTMLKNIFVGSLNNSNAVPPSALNDVAMSLGFSLGTLQTGESVAVDIMISEQGHSISAFSVTHHDSDPASSNTVITLSGVIGATPSAMSSPKTKMLVLTGQVFKDASTNGPPNPSLGGLSGVTVALVSNAVPVMTNLTDAFGRYAFSVPPGLAPGTYGVQASAATGLTFEPVPGSQKAYFATVNPAMVTLPTTFPILNFDFRGAAVQQFGNASGILTLGFPSWKLNYANGSVVGTLAVTNPAASGATFGPPWLLGLQSTQNYFYVQPSGVLADGVTNIDLTAAMSAQVSGGLLSPGQSVVLTNAVPIYSRIRNGATNTLFEIWATQQ